MLTLTDRVLLWHSPELERTRGLFEVKTDEGLLRFNEVFSIWEEDGRTVIAGTQPEDGHFVAEVSREVLANAQRDFGVYTVFAGKVPVIVAPPNPRHSTSVFTSASELSDLAQDAEGQRRSAWPTRELRNWRVVSFDWKSITVRKPGFSEKGPFPRKEEEGGRGDDLQAALEPRCVASFGASAITVGELFYRGMRFYSSPNRTLNQFVRDPYIVLEIPTPTATIETLAYPGNRLDALVTQPIADIDEALSIALIAALRDIAQPDCRIIVLPEMTDPTGMAAS